MFIQHLGILCVYSFFTGKRPSNTEEVRVGPLILILSQYVGPRNSPFALNFIPFAINFIQYSTPIKLCTLLSSLFRRLFSMSQMAKQSMCPICIHCAEEFKQQNIGEKLITLPGTQKGDLRCVLINSIFYIFSNIQNSREILVPFVD